MNRRNEDYGYVDVLTAGAGQNHILQTEIITMFPHTKIWRPAAAGIRYQHDT